MEQKLKQRICIEFCVKLQISATETFEMLNKAFPNDAPKRTTVFEWHSRFKAGRISIEDDPRQGRPKFQRTDENVQKITDLIKENPRTTLLELEQDTGISKTTIGTIVTEDLKLKKTPAKFIPRFLTNEQKLCRLATCEDIMEMTRTDPEWKDKIITGDETWVYGYDPETKPQSAEWRGQTVIKEMYLGILRRLREAIRKKKGLKKWTNGGWILHHDNARPHTAHLMTSFLAKNGTQILLQPPYFPDIAPNDFFLFPKLKAVLKGRHFDTRDDIIEKSPLALKSIPKEAYKNCFDNLEKRWRCKCLLQKLDLKRCFVVNAVMMSRVRRINVYQHVSEVDRGRIEVYQDCGLSYFSIAARVGQDLMTLNASAFVIKTGSTTQWQADLDPKEMAASDMRNRRLVQRLLTWSTNAAHPIPNIWGVHVRNMFDDNVEEFIEKNLVFRAYNVSQLRTFPNPSDANQKLQPTSAFPSGGARVRLPSRSAKRSTPQRSVRLLTSRTIQQLHYALISPPELRRKEATKKMYQKLLDSPDLEINPILQSPPNHRLKSRKPIWSRGNQLLSQNFNISEAWTNSWISSDIPNKNLITSPSVKIPGFSLPRREWVLLNRFRTGQGRCAELMKLWGYTKDPNCACNVPQSMSHILDDCPLYKFNGGISNLHSVTPEALNWLKALPLRL
ncbi:hypothetical protein LAZ67_13002887 [Cordylochernes scorpioides]|uniref:Mos1 transposase HTH domain-containing protein n=1 Tax=Cordylochernes scorpioides TaxID=51811 RepID=A0ABY6L9K0_9ARAC|nr:hypothetical protein LAZ67_13002887 [Cordylochernes scorpioides]